ncbi:MAG: hypothetical protein GEU71_02135 [Actinobacteria bacterium]|nr:hypothetical protein [Actinomycetota bacterium]
MAHELGEDRVEVPTRDDQEVMGRRRFVSSRSWRHAVVDVVVDLVNVACILRERRKRGFSRLEGRPGAQTLAKALLRDLIRVFVPLGF